MKAILKVDKVFRINKILLLLLTVVLISGCATHAKFVERNNSWIGKNISLLIKEIGYPDTTYSLPGNHKIYVYEKSRIYSQRSSHTLSYTYGYGYYFNPYNFAQYNEVTEDKCKTFFETDSKGKILLWKARGNHCVSK